jgi:ribonuclease R
VAAAAAAARASVKLKQVEYFAKLVGQKRTGVVSGVTEWGLYLQDSETGAEGMARLMSLTDDSYAYDPKQYAVIGAKSKKKIALGDPVTFTVERVDLDMRTIDLKLES